jgi:lincosamide nucleotidyltransferase A/C/D/E
MTVNGPDDSTEMTIDDVLGFLDSMDEAGIDVVVDGGWGVDALLGHQTRAHLDLDIAVRHRDVPLLTKVLHRNGYSEVHREDTHTYNFVLGDSRGRRIDVHSYEFDAEENLLFGIAYPYDSLTGRGTIAGRPVRCISPERMVEFHAAYDGAEKDRQDVLAICQKFGLPIPSYYANWPIANQAEGV